MGFCGGGDWLCMGKGFVLCGCCIGAAMFWPPKGMPVA